MARDHPGVVERGAADQEGRQRDRRARSGAARSTRSTCALGGFHRAPTRRELEPLAEQLKRARASWRSTRCAGRPALDFPDHEEDYEFVALRAAGPTTRSRAGGCASSGGLDIGARRVRASTSSRSRCRTRTRCTRGCAAAARYLVRPARPLRAELGEALAAGARGGRRGRARAGLPQPVPEHRRPLASRSSTRSTRRCGSSTPTSSPTGRRCEVEPRAAHRPRLDRGAARHALPPLPPRRGRHDRSTRKIVPPTSQNQRRIEEDLRGVVRANLEPRRRGAAPALRAGDPQPRPLHLLLDALPRSSRSTAR